MTKTLPHVLIPGDYLGYQDVVDGLPVPHLLDWNAAQMELFTAIQDMSGLTLWIVTLLIFGPLWLYAVRQINPTFRLFRIPSATHSTNTDLPTSSATPSTDTKEKKPHALSAAIELHGLFKATTLLIALGLPVALVWIMLPLPEVSQTAGIDALIPGANEPLIGKVWLVRIILLSLIFWIGFHRDGLAGDFTESEWNHRRRILSLSWRACLFGGITFLLLRFGLPQYLDDTLLRLQSLGSLNIERWRWVAGHCLLSFGAMGFALGTLFALFERRNATTKDRFVFAASTLLAFLLAWASLRPFTPAALAARYDITPQILQTVPESAAYRPDIPNSGVPDSRAASAEMAKRLHLGVGESSAYPGRTLVVFNRRGVRMAYQKGYTLDKLLPDPASVQAVQQLLDRRDYQSALSWSATKHLFNLALMRFDSTAAMDVCLRDLTHSPHNAQVARTLMQMLSICSATPQNLAILDRWSDSRNFSMPTRGTKRLLGDLYRRMGEREKALTWYRKADMPSSFLTRVSSETVMFRNGQVDGTLQWNGAPLAGVQVAVIPQRMNGLPNGLDGLILRARDQILSYDPRFSIEGFPPFNPTPLQFRYLSAATVTDATGHYHIDGLTEGAYILLCTLPPNVKPYLPMDYRLQVANPPLPFAVNYKHPTQEMGTTKLTFMGDP